jgi:selenocysteine lyase/cysteine desulfurase
VTADRTRRNLLQIAATFSALSAFSPLKAALAQSLRCAPEQILGPFYPRGKAADHSGDLTHLPGRLAYRLAAGTQNISGVIGLGAAIEYLQHIGHDRIYAHSRALSELMFDVLEELPSVQVLYAESRQRTIPIASVVLSGWSVTPEIVTRTLSDSFCVMTRSGFHCAHPLFDSQGFENGAVRFSAYLYNTVEDIRIAGDAMREISKVFLKKCRC